MSLSGFSIKRSLFVGGGNVYMHGLNSDHTDLGVAVRAGLRFNRDGSVDDKGPGNLDFTRITGAPSGEQWWTGYPNATIGDSYDVRYTNQTSSDSFDLQDASEDTWIKMDTGIRYNITRLAMASPVVVSVAATFEVGETGSGSAIDSCLGGVDLEN